MTLSPCPRPCSAALTAWWISAATATSAAFSFCWLGAASAGESAESVVYVSPQGLDAWSGRIAVPAKDGSDGPLATLHKAVESSRQLLAGPPRRIELQAGEYYLDRPVDLGPNDAGLTVEAAKEAEVVLCGGRRIGGWHREGEHLWAADLPDVKERKWD